MAKSPFRISCTALCTLLLALYAWAGWSASLEKSPAFDESAHLTAGYAYWKFNDYRLQPENGNLPQRTAGLALSSINPRLDPADDPAPWNTADVWNVGQRFLYENGNPTELMLAAGRAAMTLWGVAAALLVFAWSRRLWGTLGALLSLGLCVGSATMLAHGPLVTSDMTAAFCLLAASGAFWRLLEKPSAASFGMSLLATGAAAIAKFSFVLLIPIYAVLLAWHLSTRHRLKGGASPKEQIVFTGLKTTGIVIAHTIAVFIVVWSAFGFRYEAEAPSMPHGLQLYIPWNDLLPEQGLKRELLVTLKEYRLLPEAYTHGFAYVLHASEARGAFAAGLVGTTGWWWFFPYAFLIKSTLAELLVVAVLLILGCKRWIFAGGSKRLPIDLRKIAPLLALLVVYGTVSVVSNLNIGHRHILPLYLPLFILAGALVRPAAKKSARIVAIGLVTLSLGEAVRAYPNYLAYFNPIAGSEDQRWRHLVDSSLDWGQELPSLAKWVDTHKQPDEPVFLSYFGVGDPRREGLDVIQFAPYSSLWREPSLSVLQPGLYCVSATLLQDSYSPLNGPWSNKLENTFQALSSYFSNHPNEFGLHTRLRGTADEKRRWVFERARFGRLAQYLRLRQPDAVINSAIIVYRLDEHEIALAKNASTASFQIMIEEAYTNRQKELKAAP